MEADALEGHGVTTTAHTVSNDAQSGHDAASCAVGSNEASMADLTDTSPAIDEALLAESANQLPSVSVVLSPTLRASQDGSRSSMATPIVSHLTPRPEGFEAGALSTAQQPPRKYMYVTLATPMGATHRLRIRPTDRLERIKIKIFAKTEIPLYQQQLVFNNQELTGVGTTATQFGLQDGSVINLVPRLQAGPLQNRSFAHFASDSRKESQMLDTLATHFASTDIQQDLMDGKLLQVVTRVNGKFVVLRFTRQERAGELESGLEEDYFDDDDDEDECEASDSEPKLPSKRRDMSMLEAADEDAGATSARDCADVERARQVEKEAMADKVAGIRARLLEKRIHHSIRSHTPSTLDASSGRLATNHSARSSLLSQKTASSAPAEAIQRNNRGRCAHCSNKLGMVSFPCKCGASYCSVHRQAYSHNCDYDYQGDR